MGYSSKSTTLVLLSQQLLRPEHEIIAFRHHQPLTVADLKKQVLRISGALNHYADRHWALSMQDSFNFVAGLLALLYAGKQPRLLNLNHQELHHYYDGVLTDDLNNDDPRFADKPLIQIHSLNDDNLACDPEYLNGGFKQQILTLFTSGSTGLPKPIEKSVTQLEHEVQLLNHNWGAFTNDLFVASVSHQHMYGLTFKIMLALSCKIPFICESVLYQEQLATYQHQKIIYITTPSIIKNLDDNLSPIACDKVISSGGTLTYQEAQYCKQNFNVLPNEIYGSSETGMIATRQQHQPITPWQLFPEMHLDYLPSRSPLLISPLLALPEPLNDKLEKIDDRHFHLHGRLDRIIKISEKRVSLTYIENQINQLQEVEQAMVIPLEHNHRIVLGAVVKLTATLQSQPHEHFKLTQFFRHFLKDTLSLHEMPKKWRFIEDFPKNAQGKCTYIELKTLFDAQRK